MGAALLLANMLGTQAGDAGFGVMASEVTGLHLVAVFVVDLSFIMLTHRAATPLGLPSCCNDAACIYRKGFNVLSKQQNGHCIATAEQPM